MPIKVMMAAVPVNSTLFYMPDTVWVFYILDTVRVFYIRSLSPTLVCVRTGCRNEAR